MEKKITTPLTYGIILSLVIIVLNIIGYITGMDQQTWFKWGAILIFIVGIIYACINYGKQSEGNVTFGNTFAFGFKASAVVTCLVILFSVIFVLIFPDIKEKAIETARKQMEEKNQLTQDQIESSLALVRKTFMLFMVLGAIGYLIIGAISSLVGAAVTKKNPPSPFQNPV